MLKRINHIALAVNDLATAKQFWHETMQLPLHLEKREAQEGVDITFLPVGESEIELLQPFETNGVSRFLEKRGQGVHHICFDVDDIAAALAELKAAGVHLINEEPRITNEGKKFAFIHPKSTGGVLVELYETQKDAPPATSLQ